MKMKIGIYCPYNYFRHGGVQETIAAHQKYLTQLGHDVSVITPRPEKEFLSRKGKVLYLGTSREYDRLFDTKADISRATKKEVQEFLSENNFDILNIHEPGVPFVGTKLLKYASMPVVGTFHARLPDGFSYKVFSIFFMKPYTRWIHSMLSSLVAASETASNFISGLLGKKVRVISNGIDVESYRSSIKKPKSTKKTIIYINRLEKRKGPDLLLKAFTLLREKRDDVELVIASDGDMRQELEQYVRANLVEDVEFLGFIEDADKVELLNTADLYCAPSPYGEGFGIVLLEAIAAGIPYLAGDNEGYRTTSATMADRLLVDPNDPVLFAEKLEQLIFDKKIRKEYSLWAKKYIKNFEYKYLVKEYELLYKDLLGASR